MSSYTKSSKVVRTESMLDEYNIYFSHVLSPMKAKQQRDDSSCSRSAKTMQPQQYGHGCRNNNVYEDVDAKAEDFINRRSQKFEGTSLWKY
uniref:Uncharacterized protein n=1 Tax=Chenopodium quinoa TaxID=63459 RepID=A0A803M737_CHEQI